MNDEKSMNKKVMPHALEAEKSVLGCLLEDKENIVKVADLLTDEDFYHDHHAMIYKAISELYAESVPVDLVTVSEKLKAKNKLDVIGGPQFLGTLIDSVPVSAHLFQYAEIVKKRAIMRNIIKAGREIEALGYNEEEPVEDLLEKAQKTVFDISRAFVRDRFISLKEVMQELYTVIAERKEMHEKGETDRVETGYTDMDKMLNGGFGQSDLVILAARPSMGKTALALDMAQRSALPRKKGEKGKKVGVISLEMSKEQLVQRILSSQMGIEGWKIQTGNLNEDECEQIGLVMEKLSHSQIFIDDNMGGSLVELRAKVRRLQMEHGLDILYVDYLQLMNASGGRGYNVASNRVQEISTISRALKEMAREMNIPVVALSQLSRSVESRTDKRPMLSDLRDSGAIEQDADIVMLLYRDDYYNQEAEQNNLLEINVAKHRNGSVGLVKLEFLRSKMQFNDWKKSNDFNSF